MQLDQTLRDPLTSLYSRYSLSYRLEEEVNRSTRYQTPFSLLMLDVDYFKSINDAFGHPRGDQVLVELARRLSQTARKTDIIFRYGGDEFVLLLPNTDRNQASRLGERLNEEVRLQPFGEDPPIHLTISIGIACFPDDAQSAEELFAIADLRHYQAKSEGRDRLVAEDKPPESSIAYQEISRLIDRDQQLGILNHFLENLPDLGKGVLKVRANAGLGISRFLAEARKSANLRGYATLNLKGSPARRFRYNSILQHALQEAEATGLHIQEIDFDAITEERLVACINHWITEKGKEGLLITLDDLEDFDPGSLALARALFFSGAFPFLGIVYAVRETSKQRGFPHDLSLQATVTLEPISEKGVKIWMRHSLKFDPDSDFIHWFQQATEGKPVLIRRGLLLLSQLQASESSKDSSKTIENYRNISLKEMIQESGYRATSNLPQLSDILFGRSVELRQLQEHLAMHRLVTIYGLGGVGKSRLALQVAHERLADYPDGVYFVPLAHLSSPDQFISLLASTLNMEISGTQPPLVQIGDHLKDRKVLLVLDNIDPSESMLAVLADLLEQAPNIHFLVTAREPLNLAGECAIELSGLPISQEHSIAQLESSPAVLHFLQRIRRVQPDYLLSEADIPAVLRILQRVAGNPLGIELSAALGRIMPADQIAEQIEARWTSLHHERRGILQTTGLQSVLDTFWTLLSITEQVVLQKLTCFEGSFTMDAARAVAEASPFFLDALTSKSLLRQSTNNRLELQELFRAYLLQKFSLPPDEQDRVQRLFSHFFANQMRQPPTSLGGEEKQSLLANLQLDRENIIRACYWSIIHQLWEETSWIVEGYYNYIETIGCYQTGLAFYQQIISLLDSQTVDLRNSEVQLIYAKGKSRMGCILEHFGRYSESIRALEESLFILRQSKEKEALELAMTLAWLASPISAIGDLSRAASLLEESLALFRSCGYAEGISDALDRLGMLAIAQGNLPKAERLFSECLDNLIDGSNTAKTTLVKSHLGWVLALQGCRSQAASMFGEAHEMLRHSDSNSITAEALASLAETALELDNWRDAERLFRAGLELCLQLKAHPTAVNLLTGLAVLWSRLDKEEVAFDLLQKIRNHPAARYETQRRMNELIYRLDNQIAVVPGPAKTDNLEQTIKTALSSLITISGRPSVR